MGNHAQGIATEAKLLVDKVEKDNKQGYAHISGSYNMWVKALLGLSPGGYTRNVSSSASEKKIKNNIN